MYARHSSTSCKCIPVFKARAGDLNIGWQWMEVSATGSFYLCLSIAVTLFLKPPFFCSIGKAREREFGIAALAGVPWPAAALRGPLRGGTTSCDM
jgi:uncharacterized protein (DUF736 family)